jgi:hypothetical protein
MGNEPGSWRMEGERWVKRLVADWRTALKSSGALDAKYGFCFIATARFCGERESEPREVCPRVSVEPKTRYLPLGVEISIGLRGGNEVGRERKSLESRRRGIYRLQEAKRFDPAYNPTAQLVRYRRIRV